jgi:uncharacterized membrane protein (DUF106 family)
MDWIWNNLLQPVLGLLYVPLDWVLGWASLLPPVWAIAAVGAVSGVAVMILQKFASRQERLSRCKSDLKLLKERAKKAKESGDLETAKRLQGLVGRISASYMGGSLKPALWSVPIVGVVALWCGSRLGYLPIRPGDEIAVVGHFEERAAGFAHVVPNEGVRPAGPAIAAVQGGEAKWTLKAGNAGTWPLIVRHEGRSGEVTFPVGGRPPEPVTVFATSTPGQDALQAVELRLKDSLPPAWWNLRLQWGGWYLITALLVALPLRFLLRIQ